MATCKHCGAVIHNNATACRKCGRPLGEELGAGPVDANEPAPPSGALNRVRSSPRGLPVKQGILWLLGLAAVGVIMGLVLLRWQNDDNKNAALSSSQASAQLVVSL